MARTGRPPTVQIDWDQFDSLCGMQCTLAEIAAFFNCSESSVRRACKRDRKQTFESVFAEKRRKGFVSLRQAQIKAALAGNVTMMIWLGKNWLKQADDAGDGGDTLTIKVRRIPVTPPAPPQETPPTDAPIEPTGK